MEVDKSNEREIPHKRPPSPNHSVKSSLTTNHAYVKHRKRSDSKDSKRSCGVVRDKQLDRKHDKNKHQNERDFKYKHRQDGGNSNRDSPSRNNVGNKFYDRGSKSPIRNKPESIPSSSKIPIDEKSK